MLRAITPRARPVDAKTHLHASRRASKHITRMQHNNQKITRVHITMHTQFHHVMLDSNPENIFMKNGVVVVVGT